VRKLFLRTFGCQMNAYDSQKIAGALALAEGAEPVATPEEADLIVYNTCSVREKAEDKVYSDLGRLKHLKDANPALLIAVGGCVASQEGGHMLARAPHVDVVFGPQTLHRLPALLARRRAGARASPRSSQCRKAATSSARSASCPTRAARNIRVRWKRSSPKRAGSRRKACARSRCSGRT